MTSDVAASSVDRGDVVLPRVPARRRTRDTRPFVVGLVACMVAGAAVRVANVLWWRPTTRAGTGFVLGGDSFYYHWQANALADGHWFVDPFRWANDGVTIASSAHPPLYPLYLAVSSSFGVDTVTGHRLASCVLGVATVAVVGILAYRLAGTVAGIVGAAIVALYPQLWINDGMVMSESLVVLMAALVLLAAYSFAARPSMRNAIVLGITCGAATLTRTELSLLFPLLVLPLALMVRDETWPRRIKLVVAAGIAGAVLIVPWVTFNMTRFDEPTLLSTGTGSALSAASCDAVYYGSKIGYWDYCFKGPWPPANADESVRDTAPRDAATEYITDHLDRLPIVALARVGRIWGVFKPGQTTTFEWSQEARGRAASWAALVVYYALVPFAIVGLVAMRKRRIPIWPVVSLFVIATFAAATTFGVTRYRAPAEIGLVLAAAIGIAATVEWLRRRRVRTREHAAPDDTGATAQRDEFELPAHSSRHAFRGSTGIRKPKFVNAAPTLSTNRPAVIGAR
jgi:4-amino-4-deoxy-L-arabinose transferase-like glycosyltransferase